MNQSMILRENGQFARNGTRSRVRTPRASTLVPRMPSTAGSTLIDSNAASSTDAMTAYVMDFRKPSGMSSSGRMEATMITAENATVRPEVITDLRTAASTS